ncbi:MAG: substrate-binding domain-containing protein [Campylobacterota bacterium]|nr:substrate-binding domain-containing protein [Campylobacterota bacterium]
MKLFLFLMLIIIDSISAKDYQVGFAQDTMDNDWRLAQVKDVENEIAKYPYLHLTVKDANSQISNQILDIEYFIKNNYDFIITSPINSNLTSKVLKKAQSKGIKVILLDRGITTDNYNTFISPDNILIAKKAARFLVDKLNSKGTILMIEGIQGATPTILRTKGFMEIVNKYPDIKVIKRTANFLRADAAKVMEDIYKNNIKFDAIYSHSDSMLSGVRMVMNKKKKSKILSVGIDYIKEAKTAILNNKQDISFTYDTCGKEGVEAIVSYIKGKKVRKNITISTTMVTKANAYKVEPIF